MIDWENPKIMLAREFARTHHGEQTRKYTGELYINHPIAVAEMVAEHVYDVEAICAALLHDVVEDTPIKIEKIEKTFGPEIACYVWYLTKPPQYVGNRAKRKQLDRDRLREAPKIARFIKVMDLWHNSISIKEHDPKFWVTFREEAKLLLDSMDAFYVVVDFAGRDFAVNEFMTWFGDL